jgi:hypothetical protein
MNSKRNCIVFLQYCFFRLHRYLQKSELQKQKDDIRRGIISADDDSDIEIGEGFRIPGRIWKKLHKYVVSLFFFFLYLLKSQSCH